MIRRIAALLRRREEGITLIELIVAIGVSTIVIAAVAGFFVATTRASGVALNSESNSRQGATAMNALTRYVHAATLWPQANGTPNPAFVWAKPTDIAFYAYVNLASTSEQPVLVRFYLDSSNNVVEQRWNATSCSAGYCQFPTITGSTIPAPSVTQVLGAPAVSPTSDGQTLFGFQNAVGQTISSSASSSTGVASANLSVIRAVVVNLELGSKKAGSPGDTHLQNTLYLFNLGYSTATTAASGS